MSFADDMARIRVKLNFRAKGVYVGTAAAIHASIKDGSPITGAPGQPVDTGNLKASWILAVGPNEAVISTNAAYAEAIETGVGPYGPLTLRSTVGGFHSVQQTIAGASALQADVVRRLA